MAPGTPEGVPRTAAIAQSPDEKKRRHHDGGAMRHKLGPRRPVTDGRWRGKL